MQNKNLWFFNHYAQGSNLPGGTRHFDLSLELVEKGYNVTIFCSGYHHTLLKHVVEYNDKGFYEEINNGVKFIWVKTFPYKVNNWKRMLNTVSYALKLNKIIPKLGLEKPDYIIGSTVHPFAPLIASKMARRFKAKYIMEIRDLWPQTFIDMNLWKESSITTKFFKYIEKISVIKSSKIIVLSPLTIGYLKDNYNYNKDNILLLPNGVNKNYINKDVLNNEVSRKINITYLGGIEKVHGLEFMVDLASKINDVNVTFNIYGDGKEKQYLRNKSIQSGNNNIVWHDPVSKSIVPNILAQATLLFVSTSNVLYGSENKLYDYMASGKPIVLAIRGSHNDPIKETGCGVSLSRDNLAESATKLMTFIDEEFKNFNDLGLKGQSYVIKNRTIDLLSDKLIEFLK